jgi:3-deoxy-7-phosphoheptulonate synthase
VSLVDDVRVREMGAMPTPRELKTKYPLTASMTTAIYESRQAVRRIIRGEDTRMMVVIGPCSVHDVASTLEYAQRLSSIAARMRDRLLIIMRVYLEKPRTTVGWRGMMNDPFLDGSFDMAAGLDVSRKLLCDITAMGLPTATEMLDPISAQYTADVVVLAAIGARTTESQMHRALASGLSMPVGFKNGTDGGIDVAVHACISGAAQHSFLGITQDGVGAVVKTAGNPDGFVILRGSRQGPNYDEASVNKSLDLMRAAKIPPAVMIDCSHANSGSDYRRQRNVWREGLAMRKHGNTQMIGMMVESNIFEGKQSLITDLSALQYGVSITDACVGWDETVDMLEEAYNDV